MRVNEKPTCCCKVPSQSSCFCNVPSQPCHNFPSQSQTVLTCTREPSDPNTQLPIIEETPCNAKTTQSLQDVNSGMFCPNCPCKKCQSCQRSPNYSHLLPQFKESNPCITICLKVQPGEDIIVDKISEKELCISQCKKKRFESENESSSKCNTARLQKRKKKFVKKPCYKVAPTEPNLPDPQPGTSDDCRWCRLDHQKSVSDTDISNTCELQNSSESPQPCGRKPKRVFVFKELK
ncbi:hypothetical protein ACFFRR_007352 [Megaselia abdita]